MSGNQKTQDAVRAFLRAGVQLSPDALRYLARQPDPGQIASRTIEELGKNNKKPFIITKNMLEGIAPEKCATRFETIASASLDPAILDIATQASAAVEVLSSLYESSSSEGKLENFVAYFRDRYQKLRRLFGARKDTFEAVTISEALKRSGSNKTDETGASSNNLKLVGLVSTKRVTGKGAVALELEDPTGAISVMISSRDEKLSAKGSRILLDQVVCVEGALRPDNTVSARDITWADIPYDYHPNKSNEQVYAVLVSDVHYGSTKFLREEFEEFIGWLRGEGPTDEAAEIAKMVKYLVIAGDLVDGLGVYPNQEEELEIKDIYEQYKGLAEYLRKIPSTIEIIAIPGNHDAVRLALPQPPVPEKYIQPIVRSCSNFHMLGNPAFVKIHGVTTLVYHAKIIDTILSTLAEISNKTVTQALHEIVRCRHLAPTWDPDNPITPTNEDLLVMERIPDIFHSGHIHINAVSRYRGVLTVNSGAFQSQTSYQKSMGVKPTPGIVEIVNLMTLKPTQIQFRYEGNEHFHS